MGIPYYRFFPADYLRDTRRLTLLQHGAYRILIDEYMSAGGLRGDLDGMCRVCGALSGEERTAVEFVLSEFFTKEGPKWRHKRCDAELLHQQQRIESARYSAGKRNSSKADRPGHSSSEFDQLCFALGNKCQKCGEADLVLERDHIVPRYRGGSDDLGNVQPLCGRCNAAKGPEAVDYRPKDWRERLANAQRTLNDRPAIQIQIQDSDSEARSNPESKTSQSRVRATRLPSDWQLPQELKDWAVKVHHLEPQHVVRISLAFKDFWIGKPGSGGCKLDWAATWRNWIRKECERAGLSQLR